MTDTITTQDAEIQNGKESPQETEKSKRQSLPVYSATEMLAFCAKIYNELGFGDYHSKDLIAETHGVVYDSIKQKLSTAQAYGFLELRHGVGYKLTDKFLKIYKPVSEAEKREGIIESLRLPGFYSRLIDELNGHPLPTEQGLSARLLRSFGIKDYAASKAAQIFLINLKENGFVSTDNILKVGSETDGALHKGVQQQNGVTRIDKEEQPPVKDNPPQPGYIEIPVPLNGGKRAYIRIPEDYKPEDCERIAKFVEALK